MASLLKDWKILGLLGLGITLLGYSTYASIATPNVIHLKMDDFSESAIKKLTAQRKQHCLVTLENLESGDKVIEVHFAERAEKINSKKVSNPLTDAICSIKDDLDTTHADIGKIKGTSLTKALEMTKILIESERTSGKNNFVVATITLDATEQVEGQPPEDFEKVESLLQTITDNRSVVRIIGPQGALQESLQNISSSQSHVDVCTLTEVKRCVTEAFQQARRF